MSRPPDAPHSTAPYTSTRKARDRSFALTVGGVVFLMPPIAAIFLVDGTLFSIPLPLVFVFTIWIVLVAGAFILKPALQAAHDLESPAPNTPDGT